MIDLISHGIVLNGGGSRVEIPSASFVQKCREWIDANPGQTHAPL